MKMGKEIAGVYIIKESGSMEWNFAARRLPKNKFKPSRHNMKPFRWYPPTEDKSLGWNTTWPK